MADEASSRQILIAGAGIAGLTAALAFARRGFNVRVYEKAPVLEEIGAGLQLSPNATRLLDRLGVVDRLRGVAVRPEAVVLRDARTLREIARVPLGRKAIERWGAPYLVAHRADLQSALLSRVREEADIALVTAAEVRDAALHARGVTLSVDRDGRIGEASGLLAVGADGVWSTLRGLGGRNRKARFSGLVAWRATLRAESGSALPSPLAADAVTAFLSPHFHLVTYPLRGGAAVNLVAIAKAPAPATGWATGSDAAPLRAAAAKAARDLAAIVDAAGPWTSWPLHEAEPDAPWTAGAGLALIGDAAHAMTPFSAQGAAMAIEDAVTLADAVADGRENLAAALVGWEKARRPRIAAVRRRGALNRLAWHARGPVAFGRNLVLRALGPDRLAAQLDWLYGWRDDVRGND